MKTYNPNPSPLDTLSEAQKQELLSWLELHPVAEVVRMVRRDPPDGFGLLTYPCSLRRFAARCRLAAFEENEALAAETNSATSPESKIEHRHGDTRRHAALELVNNPGLASKDFNAVALWSLEIRAQLQKAEEIAISKERMSLAERRPA